MAEETYVALEGDLTVVFHFDVDELNVRQDLLGTVLETEQEDYAVRVEFPTDAGAFKRSWVNPAHARPKGTRGPNGPNPVSVLRVIQVQVDMGRGLGDEGSGNAESVLVREARPAARAVVRRLLDWARTQDRQVWLLPPHMPPDEVDAARLMNSAGEITHGYGNEGGVIVMFSPEDSPRGDVSQGVTNWEVPEAESLLAEAWWAIWPGNPPDTKRAILLAAIALEVKTPQTLQLLAQGDSRRLLELLLDRYDETPMSVNFQLNALAEALAGEALKAHDGKLAKSVKALYGLRNDVAHRGITPDVEPAQEAVEAAQQTFDWLEARQPKA